MDFLELWGDSQLMTGNSGSLSIWHREVQYPFELQVGAGDCSRVTAGQIDLIYGCVQKLRVPLQWRQGSRGCIQGSPVESGLISSGSKELRSPLKLQHVSLEAH